MREDLVEIVGTKTQRPDLAICCGKPLGRPRRLQLFVPLEKLRLQQAFDHETGEIHRAIRSFVFIGIAEIFRIGKAALGDGSHLRRTQARLAENV